jgi:hypothetical protein
LLKNRYLSGTLGVKVLSELRIIQFLRGFVLLVLLVAVPGVAVGWNYFSKIDWQFRHVALAMPQTPPIPFGEPAPQAAVPPSAAPEPAVCLVEPQKVADEIEPIPAAAEQGEQLQQVAWQSTGETAQRQQNFKTLEEQLKTLGAKSYKLEKWGREGNLFRFSCLVSAPDFYQYEKHFQAIGTDEMSVMQTVIAQIKQWRQR